MHASYDCGLLRIAYAFVLLYYCVRIVMSYGLTCLRVTIALFACIWTLYYGLVRCLVCACLLWYYRSACIAGIWLWFDYDVDMLLLLPCPCFNMIVLVDYCVWFRMIAFSTFILSCFVCALVWLYNMVLYVLINCVFDPAFYDFEWLLFYNCYYCVSLMRLMFLY